MKTVKAVSLLLMAALLLNTGLANAHGLTITLFVPKDGNGAGKTVIHKAGSGVWTFNIDFNPNYSAERLFIELYVKGVEVFSIALCLDSQQLLGVCYPGTERRIITGTGLPDFTGANAINSPKLSAGTYTIEVFLDDVRGDGQLSSVTITDTHP